MNSKQGAIRWDDGAPGILIWEISMHTDFKMAPPPTLAPDPALRAALLRYFVDYASGPELVDWLKGIGQDPKGTVEERRRRVLAY